MKEITIRNNDAGQRLDKFLQKAVKSLPQSLLYKYLRLKRIKVNGKRAENAYMLVEGDTVQLYIGDEFFENQTGKTAFLAAPAKVDIVYEDKNLLLADKKPGLVVHDDESGSPDTLIARIQHYLYNKGEYDPKLESSFSPSLCNRIDRNTAGIVIAAKNAEALRILNEKIKSREIKKYYLCIVHGRLDKKEGVLQGYLEKDSTEKKVYIHEKKQSGDTEVTTKYCVLGENPKLSLVEVELITGRTHQIRAHFASIGHPLLGDGKYGTNALNAPYGFTHQALCSYKTEFAFTTDAGILNYLKGKSFEIKDVRFAHEFYEGGLRRK